MKQNLFKSKILGKLVLMGLMMFVAQSSWATTYYKSLYVHAETNPTGEGKIYVEKVDGSAVTSADYNSTAAASNFDFRFTGQTGDNGMKVKVTVSDIPAGKVLRGYYVSHEAKTAEQLAALTDADLLANENPATIDVNSDAHANDHNSDEVVEGDTKYNEQYTFNATWGNDEWRGSHTTPDTYIYAILAEPFPVNVSYYIGPNVFGSNVDAQDGSYNGTAFGTFSLSPENAVVGDEVTLTATPAPGYAFSHWTNKVDDASTKLSTEATWTTTAEYATYYPVFKLAPVHIGEAKWATFSASSKVCYVDSESKNTLKVYAVVEKNAEGELAFKQMKYTTPNVGLVCNADAAGDYELTYNGLVVGNYSYKDFSTGTDDEQFDTNTNLLQGTANGTFTVPAEDDGYYYYVLANKNQGVGFYLAAAGLVIPQNKAYLKIAKSAAAKTFYGFDETTTSLISVDADVETGNVEMYNVAGQKVSDSYRGIVIVNGKKFINK